MNAQLTIIWLPGGLDSDTTGDGFWLLCDDSEVPLTFKQMEALERPVLQLERVEDQD